MADAAKSLGVSRNARAELVNEQCGTVPEMAVLRARALGSAAAVLQLVDQGHLSLDAPLGDYLPHHVRADDRAASITPRHILSHSCGLPNWRTADVPLKTYFEPGARFSYSGEGFLYLQRAIEAITGERLHTVVERLVMQPLEMHRSSFIWDQRFEPNRADPHDAFGQPALGGKPGEANAAGSLQTRDPEFYRRAGLARR